MTETTSTDAGLLNRLYGKAARSLRLGRRLTLTAVVEGARGAGHRLDVSTLSELERGLATWSTDRFAAVAAGLGAPFWFLGGGLASATPAAACAAH